MSLNSFYRYYYSVIYLHPMRIFSQGISLDSVDIESLSTLFKHKKSISNEIYSDEGIYLYSNDQLFKIYHQDGDVNKVNIGDHEVLVDYSTTQKHACSHIAMDHVNVQVYRYQFIRDNLSMIVEGKYPKNRFIVTDMYFRCENKTRLDDPLLVNNFNEFLSALK